MAAEEEVHALMMDTLSDSDSDNAEMLPMQTHGQATNGKSRLKAKSSRRQRGGGWCQRSKTAVCWALALSIVVNIALVIVLLVVSRADHATSPCLQSSNSTNQAFRAGSNPTRYPSSNVSPVAQVTTNPSTPSQTFTTTTTTVLPTPPTLLPNLTCLTSASVCGKDTARVQAPKDVGYVNLFQDLTRDEIDAVAQYMYRQRSLNVQSTPGDDRKKFNIIGVELYVPAKDSALNFLDQSTSRPAREALVTVTMYLEMAEVVRQYVVGTLPRPSYHYLNPRMKKAVPVSLLGRTGFADAYMHVFQEVGQVPWAEEMLRESFEVTFSDCDHSPQRCLFLGGQKISFGLVNSTSFIFTAYYNAEFTIIHPIPFQVLVTLTPGGTYAIRSVFYAGATFPSLHDLVRRYRQGTVSKVQMKYPRNSPGDNSVLGSMNLRGEPSPQSPHPPPRQYEPKGPRFSVDQQHVKYLEWSFNVRVSVESGPQIWDVKWSGERIVYELSLQEIVVLYAGANPSAMFSHLSDSAFGLGDNAKPLVPGVDCPDHAQFLPLWIFSGSGNPSKARELTNTVCVFEHNSGVPLRRHSVRDFGEKQYYGGLVDHYLVVRAIIVEFNYDYIMDFVFHANGALETRVYATGYIMSQWFYYGEDPFGFQVKENVVGSVHHHLFHFKVDMDIGGVSNRYETLDFNTDKRNWPWLSNLKPSATSSSSSSSSSSSERSFQQISFKHHVRKTEQDAVYHYNFDQPKYHIFYNDKKKNRLGNVRTYRLEARGFSKQLLPAGHPAVRSRRWADYCMAVTARKDAEMKSSSVFSMFDADDPVVNFDDFLADDESIMDKDLVSWVTLGMHHIPHTEDIPNTPTVGTKASILLLPFNYFPECPSVRSRDAVRGERTSHVTRFQTYGTERDFTCVPPVYGWLRASKAEAYP